MNYGSQGYEKTRIRAAVSDDDARKRTSQAKENDEWVTAANAKVRETQAKQGESATPKIQYRRNGETGYGEKKETKRNILAEFSAPDGYARGKSKPIGAINEEDTVIMTAARKKVSASDIEKRTAIGQRASQPQRTMQGRMTLHGQSARVQYEQRMSFASKKESVSLPNAAEATQQKSKKSSDWTSVKATKGKNEERQLRPRNEMPARPQGDRSRYTQDAKNQNLSQGRFASIPQPQPKKRVFTPMEAEEVILRERMPKRHIISPFTGIFILISVLLCIVCLILCISMSTRISKITVKSEDTASINDKILTVCEKYAGKSYLTFDAEAAKAEIASISALVADVEIKGAYPRKLHISVIYDTPRYYMQDEMGFVYVTSANLKVLAKYGESEAFDKTGLTKLNLPSFTVEKIGQTLKFAGTTNYVKAVTDALADYRELGEISYINFSNTQLIYFIFDGKYRCDLGNANEIDLKLKAAENTFKNNVLPSLGGDTQRTAVINVSTPSSTTYRLDAELGITE